MGRGFSTQKKVSKKALALWLIVPPFLYTMHGVYRDGFGSLFRKMKDPLVPLKKPEEPEYQGEYDVFKTAADLKNGEKRAFQVGPKEEDAVLIIKQGTDWLTQTISIIVCRINALILASVSQRAHFSDRRLFVHYTMPHSTSRQD